MKLLLLLGLWIWIFPLKFVLLRCLGLDLMLRWNHFFDWPRLSILRKEIKLHLCHQEFDYLLWLIITKRSLKLTKQLLLCLVFFNSMVKYPLCNVYSFIFSDVFINIDDLLKLLVDYLVHQFFNTFGWTFDLVVIEVHFSVWINSENHTMADNSNRKMNFDYDKIKGSPEGVEELMN
jgi:hypothetical protein